MGKYKVVKGEHIEVLEPRIKIHFRHEYGWDKVLRCYHWQLINIGLDIQHNTIVIYYGVLGLCFIVVIRRVNRK